MNKFWPSRPSPEGFSIEKLSQQYRAKIKRISNNISSDISDLETKDDTCPYQIDIENIHWANRDFREYINVA